MRPALEAQKTESINRSKSALIGEIIARLPRVDHVRFVLGPQDADALAWQLHGFATRIQYTYVLETAGSFDPMSKLRHRRAVQFFGHRRFFTLRR
jgi:hypothetical protein